MPAQTPAQKLQKANDDYHNAVNLVMMDDDVPVEIKVAFGSIVQSVFESMNVAQAKLNEHYGE